MEPQVMGSDQHSFKGCSLVFLFAGLKNKVVKSALLARGKKLELRTPKESVALKCQCWPVIQSVISFFTIINMARFTLSQDRQCRGLWL